MIIIDNINKWKEANTVGWYTIQSPTFNCYLHHLRFQVINFQPSTKFIKQIKFPHEYY